jgi:hypothetical protein
VSFRHRVSFPFISENAIEHHLEAGLIGELLLSYRQESR